MDGTLEHAIIWAWPLVLAWQTAWYLTGTPQPWTLV